MQQFFYREIRQKNWIYQAVVCHLFFAICLVVGVFNHCSSGYCDTIEKTGEAIILDTVVVTATSSDEAFRTGDVDLENTPISVSVIQREAFEGRTENLAEVIEKEVGVQVRQSGGLGSYSTVSLRGSSGDQVMVFLDGILINDASGGGVDLSTIALSDVQSIEIYRGITPVNFGKSSIGGVVNIRTIRATPSGDSGDGSENDQGQSGSTVGKQTMFSKAVASLTAGYGSFNTRKISGLINHKPGKWDYLISADHLSSDNDFEFLNDNGTQWNKADDRWEERNNAEVIQTNLLAKAGYDLSETLRLDGMNQFFKKDQGIPMWNNKDWTDAAFNTIRNITTLGLTADDISSLHLNTRTQLSYTWKEEEYDDRGGHIGLGQQHNTYTTSRLGADLFAEWLSDYHSVIASVNVMREEYETEDHLKPKNPQDSNRTTGSIGIQDSLFLFGERLVVTPGFRFTWLQDELKSAESVWGSTLDERTRNETYLTPQIGLKYAVTDALTFRSNLAQYVREPSFFELFGDRGLIMGNPDLMEEEGINFDVGVEWNLWNPSPQVERFTLNATWFRNDVDNLISQVYDARGVGRSENISGALIQGVELGVTLEFLKYFRAVLNATWQDPENESDVKAFNGKALPGHFEASSLGRLEMRYKKMTLYGEYLQDRKMYYDTANLLEAEDKEVVNIGISTVWNRTKVSLEGKNMTDDNYEDFNGYPSPGRSFYLSLKYDF